jgi:tetratricopeptide (TPR) repeat protein
VWVLLAQARFGAGLKDAALEAAVKAEAGGKENPDVLHGLAFVYAEFGKDYAKAAALESQYARARKSDTAAWGRVASLYVKAGMTENALEPATQMFLASRTPGTAVEELYFRVAQERLLKQDFEGAVVTLNKGRELLKDSAQLELALAVALYGQRKFGEAVERFLRTMEIAPDVEQSYVFVGKILEHAGGRMPELVARFRSYQQRHPDSHLGYYLAAKAIVTQGGDAQQALDLAQQAIAKKDNDPDALFLAGTLLEVRGELAEAALALERSAALRSDAPTHYRLARVYLKLGRKQDAARERALYEKLTEESSDARQ